MRPPCSGIQAAGARSFRALARWHPDDGPGQPLTTVGDCLEISASPDMECARKPVTSAQATFECRCDRTRRHPRLAEPGPTAKVAPHCWNPRTVIPYVANLIIDGCPLRAARPVGESRTRETASLVCNAMGALSCPVETGHVTRGRHSELACIFTAELTRAFIAHAKADACDISLLR